METADPMSNMASVTINAESEEHQLLAEEFPLVVRLFGGHVRWTIYYISPSINRFSK